LQKAKQISAIEEIFWMGTFCT